MEEFTFDTEVKEFSRELLYEGYTKKIEASKYWNSHGHRSDWGKEEITFDKPKKIQVIEVKGETYIKDLDYTEDWTKWIILVDGEELKIGWPTSYHALKTKFKVDFCMGTG